MPHKHTVRNSILIEVKSATDPLRSKLPEFFLNFVNGNSETKLLTVKRSSICDQYPLAPTGSNSISHFFPPPLTSLKYLPLKGSIYGNSETKLLTAKKELNL